MKKIPLFFCFAALALAGCLFEKKIDASSDEMLQKSIQGMMEDMAPAQQEKLQDSLKIIMFSDVDNLMDLAAMGQNMDVTKATFKAKVNGKTSGELFKMADNIKSARAGGSEKSEAAHSIDTIAEQAKADALDDAMNASLKASLRSLKKVRGDFSNYLNVEISFENLTDKNMKGVKGVAIFKDMFGDVIKKVSISSDDSIGAKKTFIYKGSLDLNQFSNDDQQLSSTPKEKIDFSFEPEIILFEDGSKLSIE